MAKNQGAKPVSDPVPGTSPTPKPADAAKAKGEPTFPDVEPNPSDIARANEGAGLPPAGSKPRTPILSAGEVLVPPDTPPTVPSHISAQQTEVHQKYERLVAVVDQLEMRFNDLSVGLSQKLAVDPGLYPVKSTSKSLSAFAGELDSLGHRLEVILTRTSDLVSQLGRPVAEQSGVHASHVNP